MLKKIICFLFVFTFTFCTPLAFAAQDDEFYGGSGTEDDPYLISQTNHLDNVRNYADAYFKMVCDIEFTNEKKFVPIETFEGHFDGNGFSIKNLKIIQQDRQYCGLFAALYYPGIIKNLTLENSYIYNNDHYAKTGAIVGWSSGTVANCKNDGTVIVYEQFYNTNMSPTAGGIVGYNMAGTVINCVNSGSVSAETGYGTAYAGGIVGYNNHNSVKDGKVVNCYNTATVTAHSTKDSSRAAAGGIVATGSTVTSCYNIGTVTASCDGNAQDTFAYAGGIAGSANSYSDCFCLNNTEYSFGRSKSTEGVCTAEQLKLADTYSGFDFENTWILQPQSGYEYPQLIYFWQSMVKSATVTTQPQKSTFIQGVTPDLRGATATVEYHNSTTATIDIKPWMLTGLDKNSISTQNVRIKVGDVLSDNTISLTCLERKVAYITLTPPTKTDVFIGKELDLSGGCLTVGFEHDSEYTETVPLDMSMLEEFDNSTASTQTVTVNYGGKTATFNVNVIEDLPVELLFIYTPTDRVHQDSESKFNNLSLQVKHMSGRITAIQDYQVTELDTSVVGTHTVTVSYMGLTKSFEVVVKPHVFNKKDSGVTASEATCQQKQKNYVMCDECTEYSDNITIEVGRVEMHRYENYLPNNDASCERDATETASCKWCLRTYTRSIAGTKTEHSFTTKPSAQKASAASCTAKQKNYVQCDNCNAVSDTKTMEVGNVKAHTFGEYIENNNATCCNNATASAICIYCGKKSTKEIANSAIGHTDTTKVFSDIAANKWYVEAVNYNYTHNFISGMSKTEFGVNTKVTRGMFVTILARIAGVDTSNNNVATKFTDVAKGKYYTAAIKWATENGVASGMGATAFEPTAAIQRQQLCVMIVNFAKYMKTELKKSEDEIIFTDGALIARWAKDAVKTAQTADIVNGYETKKGFEFRPENTASRAEAAQILYTFHKNFVTK